MEPNNSAGRRLGALLVEQGTLSEDDMAQALAVQEEDGKRLGEILLDRDLVSRPLLARVLAEQSGVALVQEQGFGTGLRALIERRHREKRERGRRSGAEHTRTEETRKLAAPPRGF